MKRIVIGCLIIGLALLISCSSSVDLPKEGESSVMVYVEAVHKPLNAPQVELHIEGLDKPLSFTAKDPAATARMAESGLFTASGWTTKGNVSLNHPGSFELTVTEGAVTLLPYKITIVATNQIDIRPLTELDIQYAKGQFAMSEELGNLQIIYPDLISE